jgi:uncharacterized membrane protein YtjA (UPF0391 family)
VILRKRWRCSPYRREEAIVAQVILPLAIIPLMVFYFWMLHDMLANDRLPEGAFGQFTWPPATRSDWTLVFVVLSVAGAALYFVTTYQRR